MHIRICIYMYAYAYVQPFRAIQVHKMKDCSFICLNILLDKVEVLST